jgi:hypothetical protein
MILSFGCRALTRSLFQVTVESIEPLPKMYGVRMIVSKFREKNFTGNPLTCNHFKHSYLPVQLPDLLANQQANENLMRSTNNVPVFQGGD